MKVARGWEKGDHAHIRKRNPRSTAISLSNAILFVISMLQVKVVENCQDLTQWPVQKRGYKINVLQLKGCIEAKIRSNFFESDSSIMIDYYHLQKNLRALHIIIIYTSVHVCIYNAEKHSKLY